MGASEGEGSGGGGLTRGRRGRKGAPDTFDAAGYAAFTAALKTGKTFTL